MTMLNTPALPTAETPLPPVNVTSLPKSTEEVAMDQTIMIVDDEPINIKVAEKFLALEGYSKFITTTQPKEAVALAIEKKPGILLLDIMMPEVFWPRHPARPPRRRADF